MADKMLYVLAGYDDETEAKLSGIQNRLYELGFDGVQTKNIPMHFTLGSFDTEREEELKERLIKLSKSLGEFDVGFYHIGLFRLPANDVLFAEPEVSKQMLELHDNFLDNKDVFAWSAHTTFLIDKPDVINDALKVVMNEFKPFTGKVSMLHLYEFWPTRHILSVKLKGSDKDPLLTEDVYNIYSDCMYQPTYEKYLKKMDEYISSPSVIIITKKTGDITSGLMVMDVNENGAEILGIAVSKDRRRKGIGRSMINEAVNSYGISSLYAETDDDAVGFYRSVGFTAEAFEKKYENGTVTRYRCSSGETHR